jgi:hypothetical protein
MTQWFEVLARPAGQLDGCQTYGPCLPAAPSRIDKQSLRHWETAPPCRKLFGNANLSDVQRFGLEVVINACDLRTQTAFRIGSLDRSLVMLWSSMLVAMI